MFFKKKKQIKTHKMRKRKYACKWFKCKCRVGGERSGSCGRIVGEERRVTVSFSTLAIIIDRLLH